MPAKYRLALTDRAVFRTSDEAVIHLPDEEYSSWLKAGGVSDPFVPLPPPPAEILSQDLIAQFTADDAAKIKSAVDSSAQFWLLWSAMQAQNEPMVVTNARFLQGWAALVQVLGAPRMTAIAAALGVT
jgi:hypothetical protein